MSVIYMATDAAFPDVTREYSLDQAFSLIMSLRYAFASSSRGAVERRAPTVRRHWHVWIIKLERCHD